MKIGMKKIGLSCSWLFGIILVALADDANLLKEDSASFVEIKRVSASVSPIMKNDSLLYLLDLVFTEFPVKFWSYTDTFYNTATIEIFGDDVRAPAIVLPSFCPVNDIHIKNQATKMVLSGRMATITFSIDAGWHADVAQIDSNDIRLTLGKKLAVRQLNDVFGKTVR
jgi:hypothetical protein